MIRRVRDRGLLGNRVRNVMSLAPRFEAAEPRVMLNGDLGSAAQFEPPPPPINLAPPPPQVVSVTRASSHGSPLSYVIQFDKPMNVSVVQRGGNYLLEAPGPTGRLDGVRNLPIPLKSVVYNAETNSVVIVPGRRISLHTPVKLTINGDLAGLYSAEGIMLDGNDDGRPGGNYETILQGFASRPPRPLPPWIFNGPHRIR